MICAAALIAASRRGQEGRLEKAACFCLCTGMAALFIATYLFPWELLEKLPVLEDLIHPLQFTWRFLSPASFFLCAAGAIGVILARERFRWGRWAVPVVMLLLAISVFYYFDRVTFSLGDLWDKMQMNGEDYTDGLYLYQDHIVEFHREDAAIQCSSDSEVFYTEYEKKGNSITVRVDPGRVTEGAKLFFPLYGYTGYQVLANGEEAEWEIAENGRIACDLPREETLFQIRYRESPVFLASDILSAVSVLGCVLYAILRHFRKKRSLEGIKGCIGKA